MPDVDLPRPALTDPGLAALTLGEERPAQKPRRDRGALLPGWRVPAVVALSLAVVNLWFFRDIYSGRGTFPWDFRETYHAIPFYWQAVARSGQFPEWIPYQAIGYPLQLPLQTGLYYPPLWLFPLFRLLYSTHAAAVFQCLHFLAGALGMVWLARVRGLSWAAAALAGIAYQLFGGFFGNAEHVDIVRGYALLPLLLASLTLAENRTWRRPATRCLSIPLFTLCMTTGVYPGQVPPVLAAACLYLLAQVFDARRARWREQGKQAGACLSLLLLGLLLAAPNLGPALLLKSEIDRSVGPIKADGLGLDHLFTTLFGYDTRLLPTDVSMSSFFITVPVMVGLFFVPWAALRRQRPLLAVFAAAASLIPAGFVYLLAIRLFPPFGYSRFPIADYRALVVVPAVLLGAVGLERLVRADDRLSWQHAMRATALVAFLVLAAYRFKWSALPSPQVRDLSLVLAAVAALIGLGRAPRVPRAVLLCAVAFVMVVDGTRMHGLVTRTWKGPPDKRNFVEARAELDRSLHAELSARPARVQNGWVFTRRGLPNLDGYLRGRFVADDYAVSEHLRAITAVRLTPAVAEYVYGASHPKLVTEAPGLSAARVAASPDVPGSGSATPRQFTAEHLSYEISAPGERILVENEPAFAGWRGFAHCEAPKGRIEVRPVPELWPLRAWRLPAGQYRFCEGYRVPGLRACLLVAGLALLAWAGAALWFGWRSRTRAPRKPAAPAS